MSVRAALALAAAALLTTAVVAGAVTPSGPSVPLPAQVCAEPGGQTDSPPQPRLVRARVAGVPVAVVLPVGYAAGTRRYPVVYLLHGAQGDEDSWIEYGGLMPLTAAQAPADRAIVVMPKLGVITGFATDWADGHRHDATFVARTLVGWADRHLRTLADRRHRAIAGYSGGGLSAAHVAERSPAVFGQLGVLSGPTNLTDPLSQPVTYATMLAEQACAGDDITAAGPLGDPVRNAATWRATDPTLHADRLRSTTIWLSSGNGVPCGAAEAASLAYPTAASEPLMRRATESFSTALTSAGVRHTNQRRTCGIHWWTTWTPALRDFWAVAARQWRA
ncbi:MAG TPA: alpha/beta hydrolase-fold protein [Mycobacteriales bacterium]|nr:alpha/beta hydrolase-fold protein [Mycobacteriales bacterium]